MITCNNINKSILIYITNFDRIIPSIRVLKSIFCGSIDEVSSLLDKNLNTHPFTTYDQVCKSVIIDVDPFCIGY